MKTLLSVTAVIETGAGLALLVSPDAVAGVLLGSALDSPAGLVVGRIAGAALLALGIACWMARHDGRSRAVQGLASGMVVYNLATVALLSAAALGSELVGIGAWPAVLLHLAMSVWCLVCLRKGVKRDESESASADVHLKDLL